MFRLNLETANDVSLSANHLQKLRLSFQLTTPQDQAFKPHQVGNFNLMISFYSCVERQLRLLIFYLQAILKLKHEKAEHIFVVGSSGKQFQIVLVKSYLIVHIHLCGIRDIVLTLRHHLVGFSWAG